MATAVTRLIKNLPKGSLEHFFSGTHPEIAESIDWTTGNRAVRSALLEAASNAVGDSFATLRSDANRIDVLTDELGQKILKHFVRDDELSEYFDLANEHDRCYWLYCKDEGRFRRAEDWWYVDTNRQSRLWSAFLGPPNTVLDASAKPLSTFKDQLQALFRAAGKIKVDVFERTQTEANDGDDGIIHVTVYREDLPSTELAFDDDALVSRIVRSVKEVALTYQPVIGQIDVVAEGKEQRKSIATIFSATLLQSPIKGESIPLKHYQIQKLLKSVVLSTDPADGIEFAKVTLLKVAPLNSNNNVTLDVATNEPRTIYDVANEYFGENDPLKSGFRLKRARISIKFMPDNESRRGKILHVVLTEPNGCTLKSKTQKERLIGEKYLKKWDLLETIQ